MSEKPNTEKLNQDLVKQSNIYSINDMRLKHHYGKMLR